MDKLGNLIEKTKIMADVIVHAQIKLNRLGKDGPLCPYNSGCETCPVMKYDCDWLKYYNSLTTMGK